MSFDFSKVSTVKDVQYLRPGQYELGISNMVYQSEKGKLKADKQTPKTPYLETTFSGKAGEITQKLYITELAFPRLQTLHEQWFEQPCLKVFENVDTIGAYFEKAFNHDNAKKVTRKIVVGGRQAPDGKVYAEIPYSKYIIPDTVDFEEKEYLPGSAEYAYHVRVAAQTPATTTDSVMIGGPSMFDRTISDDSLPF